VCLREGMLDRLRDGWGSDFRWQPDPSVHHGLWRGTGTGHRPSAASWRSYASAGPIRVLLFQCRGATRSLGGQEVVVDAGRAYAICPLVNWNAVGGTFARHGGGTPFPRRPLGLAERTGCRIGFGAPQRCAGVADRSSGHFGRAVCLSTDNAPDRQRLSSACPGSRAPLFPTRTRAVRTVECVELDPVMVSVDVRKRTGGTHACRLAAVLQFI